MVKAAEELKSSPPRREAEDVVAVVVPHTHWDREWYAPFETMRFHLVQFLDELIDVLEQDSALPAVLLDGQAVILEDYLEIRRGQRDRVRALVRDGRLRAGPFYVQPDEFHVSGESVVRNLLVGIAACREFGSAMREGYLPDTFGHVSQLPQILRGFGIDTFYAMRGFGADADQVGSQFWWEAPDGSRVRVEWLTESYSNAAILTDDPARMSLRHGVLVRYDSLPELLERMTSRSATRVLLLLNGGDHLRIQRGVPQLVRSLGADVQAELRLGGLEEFHELVAARRPADRVIRGELRYGARHDVFDGIGSTRTPLKRLAERTEVQLDVAERLDALAAVADGRSCADSLRYAWRELLKNHAHDSICGCSVDAVHEEMAIRFTKVAQVARAVAEDALARLAAEAAPARSPEGIPVLVLNPSAFPRSGTVDADVVFDLSAPIGQRVFGWNQAPDTAFAGYRLIGPDGSPVPFTVAGAEELTVVDALNRRKELRRDRVSFLASDVPALSAVVYRLVPAPRGERLPEGAVVRTERTLQNDALRVEIGSDGTLAVLCTATGRRVAGLFELLDDGDAGDEYGFGPLPDDRPVSSRYATWTVEPAADPYTLVTRAALSIPHSLTRDGRARSAEPVDVPVTLSVRLLPGADRVDVDVTVDNRARDHRLRLRFPTGTGARSSLAESAYGVVRHDRDLPRSDGWHERPSGAFALRRFVAVDDGTAGLQVLSEGLREYTLPADGVVDLTLLRCVGWLARLDHPLRPHKVGPQLRTPGAQCLGQHTFRLAVRPYAAAAGIGALYRAAEQFSVPLRGWAMQARPTWSPDGAGGAYPSRLGLAVGPQDVVLSAVKTAEDGADIIVRIFNTAARAVTATLLPGFPISTAQRCNLEETVLHPLTVAAGNEVQLPLQAGQIATVRLHPRAAGTDGGRR